LNPTVKNWLPAILWASLILLASSDAFSAAHTRSILENFFHWVFPSWTPHSVYKAHLVVRKCAHFFEYAILATLVMRGFSSGAKAPKPEPSGRGAEAPLSLRNADPSTSPRSAAQNAAPLGMTSEIRHLRSLGTTFAQKIALRVVLLCAVVATVDEVHQHFVPSRTSSPYDVLLDTTGAAVAMLLLTWRTRVAAPG
jgi:VanZ family protein